MTILSFIFADVQLINRQTSDWHAMQYIFNTKISSATFIYDVVDRYYCHGYGVRNQKKKKERNLIHVTVEGTKIEEIRATDNNFPIRISHFMRNCN